MTTVSKEATPKPPPPKTPTTYPRDPTMGKGAMRSRGKAPPMMESQRKRGECARETDPREGEGRRIRQKILRGDRKGERMGTCKREKKGASTMTIAIHASRTGNGAGKYG